jgi:hypothetical protein
MDVIFALAYDEGVSPVIVSLRKDIPLAGSKEADRILGVEPGFRSGTSDAESETHGQENKNKI